MSVMKARTSWSVSSSRDEIGPPPDTRMSGPLQRLSIGNGVLAHERTERNSTSIRSSIRRSDSVLTSSGLLLVTSPKLGALINSPALGPSLGLTPSSPGPSILSGAPLLRAWYKPGRAVTAMMVLFGMIVMMSLLGFVSLSTISAESSTEAAAVVAAMRNLASVEMDPHLEADTYNDLLVTLSVDLNNRPYSRFLFEDPQTHYGRNLEEFVWAGENLCFVPGSGDFLFATESISQNFTPPSILSDRVSEAVVRRSEVRNWIPGLTAITSGFPFNQTGAHFYFWVFPAFHMASFARRHLGERIINIAFDDMEVPTRNTMERAIADVTFSFVQQRISLSRLRGLTCFERAIYTQRVSPADTKMTAFPQDLRELKDAYSKFVQKPVVLDCADRKANHQTIWVAQRRVYSRKIINLHQVISVVRKVFGPEYTVLDFDSANTPCVVNSKNCLGFYNCKLPPIESGCPVRHELIWDAGLFQNMTFLISVHGATFMNLPWIPERSHVVEIFPYGVTETCYEAYSARANLKYFRYREPNSTIYDSRFKHIPPDQCFADNQCRWETKKAPVWISTVELEKTLTQARDSYSRTCVPRQD